eukprot:CAMPEP_0119259416 /NCGR_PEP_ID=MMETSP1329-20130426/247_1 /TAXON_ID=114041 /ORGANISM="Genus nov. species nov., Strain RCC1024" /LENGTH=483 /DNA_ID=CAMNT_0007258799 /DNA_START=78 /DNA_END=1525 /DNA_ORIENTATION=-
MAFARRAAALLILGLQAAALQPSARRRTQHTVTRMTADVQPPADRIDRRAALAGGALTVFSAVESSEPKPDDYGLWGVLPVGPYKTKRTAPPEKLAEGLWTFDQKFGILNVQVPLRMVVVKLSPASGGGLWVYNPIAATRELLGEMRKLEAAHGPVRHVVLGTVAIEHKTYAGVFASKFPKAQVWVQPGQYAVPVNLPVELLGFPRGTRPLPANPKDAPWAADFDAATLGPFISRDGAFGETVFLHRASKTLLVTDTIVKVAESVPAVYTLDEAAKKPLLYHARDGISQQIDPADAAQLARGWRRVQLFGLYFMPAAISVHGVPEALKERRPDVNPDFGGIYPWDWVGDDVASFRALSGARPDDVVVAPILQTLILNRNPVETLDWADKVASWDFKRIVPAHLKNDIPAGPKAFRRAFTFLEEGGEPRGQPKPLAADLQTLRNAEASLEAMGAIAPVPGKLSKTNRAELVARTRNGCRGGLCG